MWFERFDGDLYKLIPEAQEIVAPLGAITLFTRGIPDADGKLNHPACWNSYQGMVAFFGTATALIEPAGYVTDEPLIRCTAEEALRDCYPHHYILVLKRFPVFNCFDMKNTYVRFLMDRRGVSPMDETEKQFYVAEVVRRLRIAAQIIPVLANKEGV